MPKVARCHGPNWQNKPPRDSIYDSVRGSQLFDVVVLGGGGAGPDIYGGNGGKVVGGGWMYGW